MVAYVAGGLAVASAAAAVLLYFARPARAIWRGDTARTPIGFRGLLTVTPRTYPSALLCVAATAGAFVVGGTGFALAGLTGAKWPDAVIGTAGILIVFNVVLVPLHWFVDATNRPKFLVPPPLRGRPGGVAAARERRRRKRAGQPETDHLVEIFHVSPAPGDDYEPYLVAICAEDGCGWLDFADKKAIARSEEDQLRARAARHTTNVAREVRHRP